VLRRILCAQDWSWQTYLIKIRIKHAQDVHTHETP
jgi:hypothetical protein